MSFLLIWVREEEEDEQLLRKSGPKRRLPVLGCCRTLCRSFGQLLLTARVATSSLSLIKSSQKVLETSQLRRLPRRRSEQILRWLQRRYQPADQVSEGTRIFCRQEQDCSGSNGRNRYRSRSRHHNVDGEGKPHVQWIVFTATSSSCRWWYHDHHQRNGAAAAACQQAVPVVRRGAGTWPEMGVRCF